MEALSNDIDSCTGIVGIEILATDLRGRCFVDPVAGFSKSVHVALACFFLLARLLLPFDTASVCAGT
jgi:hypothetical protein